MIKQDTKAGYISAGVKYLMATMIVVLCILTSGVFKASAEEDNWIHYYGTVTGNIVNVRTGAGTKFDQVIDDNGKAVQLEGQQQVIILEDALADDGNLWYKITFERGGKTYEGFSSGSYIAKDDSRTITPSPAPTATPEPTVSPTPVDIATSTPKPTTSLIKHDDSNTEGNSASTIKSVILAVVIIAVIFIAGLVFLSFRQKKNRRRVVHSSRKVDRIRRTADQENDGTGRRKPELRRSAEEEAYSKPARREVYFTNEISDEEEILASLGVETDGKKSLRNAVDRLQEHDIITHSIYGEGEVYDNSDVKLIEVRFGNDVRFLNKDSIVNKGLVTIVDDEEQSVAKRRRRRKKPE